MKITSNWLRMGHEVTCQNSRTRGRADLRHYDAEYCEWGVGQPLVLIPGLAGGIDLLSPLAQQLSKRFHVIAYQIRGENDCFALRQRFGLPDLVSDLAEFVRWRGLERPLILGVSFGGVIGLNFAAKHPDRLTALGLQGMGMRFESGLVQRIAGMVLSSYPLPEDCAFLNQFFNLLFGTRPAPRELEHVVRTCWQTDQSVMTHRLKLLRRLSFQKLLPQVTVPTLLVAGEKDVLVSKTNAESLAAGLPAGIQRTIPKAGHLAPVSHTNEMAQHFERFFSDFEA